MSDVPLDPDSSPPVQPDADAHAGLGGEADADGDAGGGADAGADSGLGGDPVGGGTTDTAPPPPDPTPQPQPSAEDIAHAQAELETLPDNRPESSPLGSLAIIRRLLLPLNHPQRLVINPLVANRQLGTTTVDLRLGTEWEAMKSYRFGSLDPGEDPHVATELLRNGVEEFRLTAGQREGIVLHPGELLLALTMEYLKLPGDLWGVLEGRSTWARQGLQVHATAGMVDAGFEGYLTLELQNTGRIPLVLYPGLRVGQMAFHPITMTAYAYNTKPHAGYSGQARARSRFVHEPEHRFRYAYVKSQTDAEHNRQTAGQEPEPTFPPAREPGEPNPTSEQPGEPPAPVEDPPAGNDTPIAPSTPDPPPQQTPDDYATKPEGDHG